MLKMFLIIRINILYINRPESPIKFFLRTAIARHIDSQEELLEVNDTILITVEGPEDMITELPGIAGREALAVDLHEGRGVQPSIRTVRHEPLVPLLDGVLVILGVHHEELHVCLRQPVLAALCPHDAGYGDWAVVSRQLFS